jgi:hypothetical protein
VNITIASSARKAWQAAHSEPHPIIVRRIMDRYGVSPSLARTIALLAGLGDRA